MRVGIRVKKAIPDNRHAFAYAVARDVEVYTVDDLGTEAKINGVTRIVIDPITPKELLTATITVFLADLQIEDIEATITELDLTRKEDEA